MITKFSTVYAGHVDLGDMGQQATPANERTLLERAPGLGVHQGGSHRALHGRPRLSRPLAGRAPLPARGLRVHPQHHDGGGASRASHAAPPDRVRLQHRAHVASAPPRRGLRHRRHPHRRALHLRGAGAAITPAKWRPSAAACCDADANRALFEEQVDIVMKAFTIESLLASGPALHLPPAVPYRGYEPEGAHARTAPAPPAGGMLAAHRERGRPRARLHDRAPHPAA